METSLIESLNLFIAQLLALMGMRGNLLGFMFICAI